MAGDRRPNGILLKYFKEENNKMTTENVQPQKKPRKPRNKWTHIFQKIQNCFGKG